MALDLHKRSYRYISYRLSRASLLYLPPVPWRHTDREPGNIFITWFATTEDGLFGRCGAWLWSSRNGELARLRGYHGLGTTMCFHTHATPTKRYVLRFVTHDRGYRLKKKSSAGREHQAGVTSGDSSPLRYLAHGVMMNFIKAAHLPSALRKERNLKFVLSTDLSENS